MNLRHLLDTSIVSAPITRTPNPLIVRRIRQHGHQCAIAAPVWHELRYGCKRLPQGARRRAVNAYLQDVVAAAFPILAYDEAAAAWHADERARLESRGRPTPFVDGQIAAIASTNQLVLVTLNKKDFIHFKDLEVVDWSARRLRS